MTPLVLLPGMMCDARLYGPQIAELSGKVPLHLAPVTGHASIGELAEEILQNAPSRFALAGLSMGGIVAMEVVRQAPERVARLALLDTNPRAELDEVKQGREPQIDKVRAGSLKDVMRDELKPNYLANGPRRQDVLDLCMNMALDLGAGVFERQSRALQTRPDQQKTLAAVACPTLILMGAEDRLCPLDRHELMHDLISGSTLTVVEGAGHLPTLEQPDAVNEAFKTWLEI
ncbi:alpha/beta fold hydrolase [Roseibium porphyridii]|uniref:Alpha/beta fold hydrolase n=1 Tax=Roseibium porphyridii TaxID=2866279 RepID=A0ABY8EZL1_9HYPH|nr:MULTISPECIES: alpha/beta fold hydrolase [Stappiaceae]QFT33032.1 Pimeloyl-[acyl-carrier protein] methyl ester esterase [Labrenzia sp. THAF82]WFE88326.1 alpha/beta fold hydrolase [Roseibium sp. KMA01]